MENRILLPLHKIQALFLFPSQLNPFYILPLLIHKLNILLYKITIKILLGIF
jgi:hypothetical protein